MVAATRLIRRTEVETLTGLRRSTIYDHIQGGRFPRPIRLGARSVAWLESEINDWIAERIAASRPLGDKSARQAPAATASGAAR
jgi:prophage regulatory protein